MGATSRWLLYSFKIHTSFLEHFLTFWPEKIFILYFPSLALELASSLKNFWLDLGTICLHFSISLSVSVCVCIKRDIIHYDFTPITPILVQYHRPYLQCFCVLF